jgi:hypothetical protein
LPVGVVPRQREGRRLTSRIPANRLSLVAASRPEWRSYLGGLPPSIDHSRLSCLAFDEGASLEFEECSVMASAAIPTHGYAIAHGAVPIGNSEGVVVSFEEMAKGDELRFQSFRLQTHQPFALPSTPPFILNFFPLCGSLRNLSLKIEYLFFEGYACIQNAPGG